MKYGKCSNRFKKFYNKVHDQNEIINIDKI